MKSLWAIAALILATSSASANMYTCAKMVYKDGWLRKYDSLGNTWGANTKRSGLVSSSIGSSIEKTTSSVDPGVSTGSYISTSQYTSSWGECSMVEYQITKEMRENYIDLNMSEIRNHIAMGEGHHVDSLAYISGCKNLDRTVWSQSLQKNMQLLYDAPNGKAFAHELNDIVSGNPALKANCAIM